MASSSSGNPQSAVFLSYAREDTAAAIRLAEGLRAVGMEVWFDQNELRGGDEWDRAIRRQIRDCALFLPLISAGTQVRTEGYFRLEWHLAEQRSLLKAKGLPFIVPVCIDVTPERDALVPEAFLAVQWTRLAGGEPNSVFIERMRGLHGLTQVARALPDRAPTAPVGTAPTIPDYELVRLIGSGSYGDVWLARGVTGIWRAIKVVWRDRFADAAPFEREFRGLKEFAQISLGESIQMALLHVGRNEAAGYFYYVMELADDVERGRHFDPASYVPLTLTALRNRRGRLPLEECVRCGVELARVLAGLHRRGLVHRDIKPSNVIVVGGVTKLADIGLVSPASEAKTFIGTEGFVPPEGPGTPGGDVFALGKVLYELATGLDRQEFPQLPPDLSRLPDRRAFLALNEIILHACEPVPEKRYRDAATLLADLEALQAGKPVRRLARWQLAAAALLIVGLAGGAWWRASAPSEAAPSAPAAPKSSTAPTSDKSLVVLPLENLSPDPADAFFTEGMHEEIIQTLSRMGGLSVRSRSTALALKDTKEPLALIARRLGVAFALSGSLRRSGKNVRVSLELRKTDDESVVWQKRFEQEFIDGFALQDEVAAEVAKAMRVHTSTGWFAGAKFMTKNAEAYDLFLKARDLPAKQGPSAPTFREQAVLGERAMALDPEFMSGASLLSQAYTYLYTSSRGSADKAERTEFAAKAQRWAERASALMPGGAGDGALAVYYSRVELDPGRALVYAQNEVRALPNDPNGYNRLGIVANWGRYREALAALNRALALDPMHARALYNRVKIAAFLRDLPAFEEAATKSLEYGGRNVNRYEIFEYRFNLTGKLPGGVYRYPDSTNGDAMLLWLGRRFEELLAETDRLLANDSRPHLRFQTLMFRAWAAQRLGRTAVATEAAGALLMIAEQAPESANLPEWQLQWMKMQALALADRKVEALTLCRRLIEGLAAPEQTSERWARDLDLALLHACFGDQRECVEILKRLLLVPSGVTVTNLRLAPDWDRVRDDPGFQALLADPKNSWPLGVDGPIPPAPGTVSTVGAPGLSSAPTPPPSPSVESVVADKSLVVLPLENLSPDPADAYFTDGMLAEIIATLSRIPELRVMSRASTLTLKGTTLSLTEAAQKFGVANVMTGTVRRAGRQIRIQLELRRARDETLLWSQTYAQELTDPFALQSDIADKVARALQARESKGAFGGARFSTKNPEAFDLFLKARGLFQPGDFRGEGMLKAKKLLDEALALDPEFVSAASLQVTLIADLARGSLDPAQKVSLAAEAKRYAELASRLAPGGAGDGHLAFYYVVIEGNGSKALSLADNAVRALPNDAVHHNIRSIALAYLGRTAESLQASRRACELDPLVPVFRTNELLALLALRRTAEFEAAMASDQGRKAAADGLMLRANYELKGELPASFEFPSPPLRIAWLWRARRFAEADTEIAQVRTQPPAADIIRWQLLCRHSDVLRRLGRAEDAAQAARESYEFAQKLQSVPEVGPSIKDLYLAGSLVRLGKIDEAVAAARRYVEETSAITATGGRWRREAELAEIYTHAGLKRECIELLAKLINRPGARITVPILRLDPDWDNLRDEPAFHALLADPKNSAPL